LSGCALGVLAAGAGAGVAAGTVDPPPQHAAAKATPTVAQRPSPSSEGTPEQSGVLYLHGGVPPSENARE
jgi:hypothetical protein